MVPKAIRPILQFIFEDGFPHQHLKSMPFIVNILAVVTTCRLIVATIVWVSNHENFVTSIQ